MDIKKRLYFISRAFPPVIGGIENQNKAVYENLSQYMSVKPFVNKNGKKALPFFLPWTLIKLLFAPQNHLTLLGDGVLAIVPWCIKKIKPKSKYLCITHGLDVTYASNIYQNIWVKTFFHSVDHFIAVSQNTKDLLIKKGIEKNKITVIPNGFDFSAVSYHPDRAQIDTLLNINTENKILLLTLGRLVKRKGVKWFILNVLPNLPPSIIYVVAGTGPEEEELHQLVRKNNLSDKVKLQGKVSESEKRILLSNCDLFIQPNIKVKNDVEGFGISVIEASAYGLPVIAANLEGLKDAIYHNKNGWLVESGNSIEFTKKITNVIASPQSLYQAGLKFKNDSRNRLDWSKIIHEYNRVLNKLPKVSSQNNHES